MEKGKEFLFGRTNKKIVCYMAGGLQEQAGGSCLFYPIATINTKKKEQGWLLPA